MTCWLLSAVGLFCSDKFEETPNEKVVNMSKLTKFYFSSGKHSVYWMDQDLYFFCFHLVGLRICLKNRIQCSPYLRISKKKNWIRTYPQSGIHYNLIYYGKLWNRFLWHILLESRANPVSENIYVQLMAWKFCLNFYPRPVCKTRTNLYPLHHGMQFPGEGNWNRKPPLNI